MAISTLNSLDAVVRDYAFPDIHIGASEEESPWVPFPTGDRAPIPA